MKASASPFSEAAACGIPAIGSNAGGIPDAVLDGQTGILVDQESPQRLAAALTFLYENPDQRISMGEAAMERARNDFSPSAVAAHFHQEMSLRPSSITKSDQAPLIIGKLCLCVMS